MKNFHTYYLSNDRELLYHYITPNYKDGFLAPLQSIMQKHAVTIHTDTPICNITAEHVAIGNIFTIKDTHNTAHTQYNEVIIASDIHATKKIIQNSPTLTVSTEQQKVAQQLDHIPINQRYSVYRIWIKDCLLPFDTHSLFTSFERITLLDTVTQVDSYDDSSKQWATEHNGHVLELHCYAVPDSIDTEQNIKHAFLQDLAYYFSQFTPDAIVHEDIQIHDNFTPFTVGLNKYKPTTHTGTKGCYFAGDWVSLPVPCSLLEAAHTSARFATNKILSTYQIQELPIYSVPLKGML